MRYGKVTAHVPLPEANCHLRAATRRRDSSPRPSKSTRSLASPCEFEIVVWFGREVAPAILLPNKKPCSPRPSLFVPFALRSHLQVQLFRGHDAGMRKVDLLEDTVNDMPVNVLIDIDLCPGVRQPPDRS